MKLQLWLADRAFRHRDGNTLKLSTWESELTEYPESYSCHTIYVPIYVWWYADHSPIDNHIGYYARRIERLIQSKYGRDC